MLLLKMRMRSTLGGPRRLQHLRGQVEVRGNAGHGVLGRHAGARHGAGGMEHEVHALHRLEAILLPGEVAADDFDARIGDDRRTLVHRQPYPAALSEQRLGKMGSDEAGTASDQREPALKEHRRSPEGARRRGLSARPRRAAAGARPASDPGAVPARLRGSRPGPSPMRLRMSCTVPYQPQNASGRP